VNETELAVRMLTPQLGVALHRGPTIYTLVDHGDPIVDALIVFRMRVQRLDHEPLLGVCSTHFRPAHGFTVAAESDIEQLLDEGRVFSSAESVLDGSGVAAAEQNRTRFVSTH
jgi:hypothetical protein